MNWQSYSCKRIKNFSSFFPYSQKLWVVAGVKSPVKNGLQLCLDEMGGESDFHDFLIAEELLSFDTH